MNDYESGSVPPPERRSTTIEFSYLHPMQTGKVLALLYAFLALILVPFMLVASVAKGGNPEALAASLVAGVFLLVIYPALGFVGGVVAAFLYNLVAGWVGGIRVDLR